MLKGIGRQWLCILMILSFFLVPSEAKERGISWDDEELRWLSNHTGKTLVLGLDPYTGMDYFELDGKTKGYLIPFVKEVEQELGVRIQIEDQLSWSEVLSGLQNGQIDIIFGANENPQRLKIMSFTQPLHQYPYSVYALKNGKVGDIGDLDKKRVGFLEADLIGDVFSEIYKNIRIGKKRYPDQTTGLKAVLSGEIDAFVTANGGITKEFTYEFPQIKAVADVRTFTSDMTLSTRKSDVVLARMIDKVIARHKEKIETYIGEAEKAYNVKLLKFSPEERAWLNQKPTITVGAATDYLPFDYYEAGSYRGIAGDLLTTSLNEVGVSIKVVSAPFDQLYALMESGKIDVLNMAKTEERATKFDFTHSFLEERDEIYGMRRVPYVQDIYALEGKSVAVVKGYWHKAYLEKNLSQVKLIQTNDLKESLSAVASGKADYFIENPTVAQYYIDGLGYTNVIQKGKTSQDSYLYFGVNKRKPYLAEVINKSLTLVQYEKIKSHAMMSVPVQKNIMTGKLIDMLLILGMVVAGLIYFLQKLGKELINQKAMRKVLEERQKLIYRDGLTGLFNRMYFNDLEKNLDESVYPQYFVMADLNGLKMINDTYGHATGDAYILAFRDVIRDVFSDAILIRMGGDEFLIIIGGGSSHEIEARIKLVSNMCERHRFTTDTGEVVVPQAAFGWGVREFEKASIDQAVMFADQMMYYHKATFKRRRMD